MWWCSWGPETSAGCPRVSWPQSRRVRVIDATHKKRLVELLAGRVAFDEPMARYTSLRVGGPADALARVESRDELARLLAFARSEGLDVHVLGAGFNTLVLDGGLRGLVVRLTGLRGLRQCEDDSLYAEAGATHSSVARFCGDHGLAGLEFAVGIPGTVGGWIRMNAGIGTHEMKDVVSQIEIYDPAIESTCVRDRSSFAFRYRGVDLPRDSIVVSGRLHTRAGDPDRIKTRMREYLAKRRASQPVDQPSCGSVFKNPPGEAAGRLVEAAGLRGARIGGAEISHRHANFIVNRGGATAADVLALIERARERVAKQFGIELETEVLIVGEAA